MDSRQVIRSQYLASLEMLKQAIVKCPDALWNDASDKIKFWHIAFHALFFTHLYLQNSEQEFKPWARYRKDYQFLGPLPWPPHNLPNIGEPYSKEDVLNYLELCQHLVDEKTAILNLEAESGFSWLKFNKFELQIYNIRHIQQHAGELMERLGTRAKIDVDWIGKKHE
jgi:hypothetical protein